MGIIDILLKIIDSDEKLISSATDEDLAKEYERKRKIWLETGGNKKTTDMIRIENEMTRRSDLKWMKDPRRETNPTKQWSDKNRWE